MFRYIMFCTKLPVFHIVKEHTNFLVRAKKKSGLEANVINCASSVCFERQVPKHFLFTRPNTTSTIKIHEAPHIARLSKNT